MELTMTNNFGFCELNENEMMMVDGGLDGWMLARGLGQAALGIAVCAASVVVTAYNPYAIDVTSMSFAAGGMKYVEGAQNMYNSWLH